MRKIKKIASYLIRIISVFLTLSLFSCTKEKKEIEIKDSQTKLLEVKGVLIPIKNRQPPQTILLDTMPKPQRIDIPSKAAGFYTRIENKKEEKIELEPPVVTSARSFYIMENFTTNDGLAFNAITSSIVDKYGNLWFGTLGGGVSRYDGKSFTNYTRTQGLPNDTVFSVLEDRQGNLWFGTIGGVSKYDGRIFTNYSTEDGLLDKHVRSIKEDKSGNLWFGTDGGISKYDGKSFTNYTKQQGLAQGAVWSILEDKNGNLWFGTEKGGVSLYDGKSFTNYTTVEGLVDNFVTSILEDKNGNLWFGTKYGGVSRYDGISFTNYRFPKESSYNDVWSILEDKSGDLWFSSAGGGVNIYNGKSFTNYRTAQGLPSDDISSIVEDKSGNLWFSTFEAGVSRFDGRSFTNYSGLILPFIRSIMEDKKGNLWFGTDSQGLSRYDGTSFTTYSIKQGLAGMEIYGLLEDKAGNIWIGTTEGLSKYDGKSFTNYSTAQGLTNDYVNYILEDNEGKLWFGTYGGGASQFNGTAFTNFTKEQGLVSNYIYTIRKDKKGNLWFGTDAGISKYDGDSFTNFTTEEGLINGYVSCILEDNEGNLWFGTYGGGLIRYDGKSFINYRTLDGMQDDEVYQIILTKEQDIILSTNQGLTILKGFTQNSQKKHGENGGLIEIPAQNNLTNEELKKYQPVFEIFNHKMGYPVAAGIAGQNTLFLDSKGIIWFGTSQEKTGIVAFDYSALYKNKNPLYSFVQKVKINRENLIWNDIEKTKKETQSSNVNASGVIFPPFITEEALIFGRPLSDKERDQMRIKFGDIKFDHIQRFYPVPENLELPYRNNNITFDFGAIEPAKPQDVLYQFKLEGHDKDWSAPSTDTSATFDNIYEGVYQFKLKTQSPFGIWSKPTTYTFRVLPPWFRTWWAYSLYVIFSVTGIYLIFLWRTAVLRKRYEQLEILYKATERFVPKAFLNLLKKEHIQDVKLGDCTESVVTVLFTDIRGYTTLTEKLNPKQAYSFINGYLKYIVPIISAHNGFISQYQGDGIMALFPRNADDGIKAVLDMVNALVLFNEEQSKINGHKIQVGYGLNTGPAMLGTIGSEERMDANVISDAINLASRVESLNKYYGTEFLMSDATLSALSNPNEYILRLVDKVQVKGRVNAIRLYEVYQRGGINENEQHFIAVYEKSFYAYEKGNLDNALDGFKECLILKPQDVSSGILIKRCEDMKRNGIPENWDGIYAMTHK
jgi:ligand-binding sensor domain-containing protein/class 3 adenylate cyclase